MFSSTPAVLRAAWRARSRILRKQRMQIANDALTSVVTEHITSRRIDIENSLFDAIHTADSVMDLSAPLWAYLTPAYDPMPGSSIADGTYASMDQDLRDKGYRSMVGRATPSRYPSRDWVDTLVPVDDVVMMTDFMKRIALLFGEDTFRVSRTSTPTLRIEEPLGVTILTVELRLHYHPNELNAPAKAALQRVKSKYERYTPTLEAGVFPRVWPEELPETPGFSNRTPPEPASPIGEPPILPRRTNGGGLKLEDVQDSPTPARRLSFSDAARDTTTTCYCGYDHPEPE